MDGAPASLRTLCAQMRSSPKWPLPERRGSPRICHPRLPRRAFVKYTETTLSMV